jgi:hypothetical protein
MPRSSQHHLRIAKHGSEPAGETPSVPACEPPSVPADQHQRSAPATFTATLVALDSAGQAWVEWQPEPATGRPSKRSSPAAPIPLQTSAARSTVALCAEYVGREVLVCRANRAGQAVIIGVLQELAAARPEDDASIDLLIQRRRVVLSARTEVVLRCGEGSITLSRDGKVSIRGVDVVSSAVRTQRIRGGAVRIN